MSTRLKLPLALGVGVAMLAAWAGIKGRLELTQWIGRRATSLERTWFDFRSGQKPTRNWEALYDRLPRVGWAQVSASAHGKPGEYPEWGPARPAEFLAVERGQRFQFLFENWRLEDFLSADTRGSRSVWPQYLALDRNLLRKLRLLFTCLEQKHIDTGKLHMASAFRSPAHNEDLREENSAAASLSQHMYGRAVDLLLDDLNGDGRVDRSDRAIVERCLTGIDTDPRLPELHGWISNYPQPYRLHFDCRASAAISRALR